jgi:type II secretory pathway component GspD/PulD (secretin)
MGATNVGFGSRVVYSILALVCIGLVGVSGTPVFAQDDTALPTKPVTIQVVEAPVKIVLDQLFKSAGLNYTIDPQVTGNVTVNLTNIPFNSALHVILQASDPPLTFSVSDNVYSIKQKLVATDLTNPGGEQAPAAGATTPAATTDTGDTSVTKQVKRMQLNYVDAASLMMYVLGGGSILPSLTSQMSSQNGGGMNGGMNSGMGGNSGFGGNSGGFGGGFGGL